MKKIMIGVIGAGRIGKLHIEHLSLHIPQAELVAIADINKAQAQSVALQFNVPKAVSDYHELLTEQLIEAVIICSATNTHAQIVQDAASAGKHIFCEKPIDFDLDRIDQTLAAVEKAGVKFQVGFNRRFDRNFRRMHERIVSGQIGKPHILRITSRDPAPPSIDYVKASGGIFLDMTIHDFDMARYLIDSEVLEVYATGGVMIDPQIGEAGDIDTAVITLKFANKVIGTIDNSRQAVYGYDQRVEVFGSEGMLRAENPAGDDLFLSKRTGIHTSLPPFFFVERYKESYITEMKEFLACIQNDTPPLVTGNDGRVPVAIGLAAMRSYRENRPVRLRIEKEKGVSFKSGISNQRALD